MKTISIGRGDDCKIVLNDAKVSRHHAILKLYPSGKIEIVDISQNGTWVNGRKIPSNVPYKIKRNDGVIFANAERLNWSLVPKQTPVLKYVAIVLGTIIALLFLIILCVKLFGNTETIGDMGEGGGGGGSSTAKNKEEKAEKKEKSIYDFFAPTPKHSGKKPKSQAKPSEKNNDAAANKAEKAEEKAPEAAKEQAAEPKKEQKQEQPKQTAEPKKEQQPAKQQPAEAKPKQEPAKESKPQTSGKSAQEESKSSASKKVVY